MSADSNDSTSTTISSTMTGTGTMTKSSTTTAAATIKESQIEQESCEGEGGEESATGGASIEEVNVVVSEQSTVRNDLEGDENADEIELRVDDMKTPKGEVTYEGKEAIKRLFKVNSKEEKGRKKSGKGKTKSNSELSTADTASAAESNETKTKKSSSNRSINRNNSSGKTGYNIFNFLFHNPTTEK